MSENNNGIQREPRSKRGFIIIFLCLFLIFMLPFVSVAVIALALPAAYEDTFVGELGDKYDLLAETDEPKIVVVGGSSVAFGIDSAMIEEELGMKVVNFGLYANLGTKLMIDLSRTNVNEGDIIVLAPEMNDQTLSLYFNAETTMQAIDGSFGMLKDIDSDNYEALVGASWKFASDKLGYTLSGDAPENSGAYRKEWFNEYGDNTYDRPYNTMTTIAKTITLDYSYDSDDGVTTEYEQFIDYVNEYVEYCTDKGATVYFSFPPMNEAAMTDYNTAENISAFYDDLRAALHCRVISDVSDYIMDEGYFFDSEFHLNNSGVTVRTVRLIDDIKREMGRTDVTMRADELPEPSGYAPADFAGGDEENLYFVLEAAKNGAGQDVWYIVGLNDAGKEQVSLSIPNNSDGIPIVGIRPNAFAGAEVRTLMVGENISDIMYSAFGGAESLASVYIPKSDPNDITIPNNSGPDGLATKGASAALRIYVPADGYESYKGDYFWGDYEEILVSYVKSENRES